MITIPRLNSRGASHLIALMLVLVLSGIIGSYFLIFSHADTLAGSIAFVRKDGIYIMSPDGSNQKLLFAGVNIGSAMSWSPDGSTLAFSQEVNGVTSIFTIDSRGQNLKQVTTIAYQDNHPTWSPDGTRIAFARRPINSKAPNTEIDAVNRDGSGLVTIVPNTDQQDVNGPDWSPDGSKLLYGEMDYTYVNGIINYGSSHLKTVTLDGATTTEISHTAFTYGTSADSAQWSPDGSKIAYTASFTPSSNRTCAIYTYDLGTGQDTLLYNYDNFQCIGLPWQQPLSWSPDGQAITFSMAPWTPLDDTSAGTTAYGDIYTVSSTGGGMKNILQSNDAAAPAWEHVPPPIYTATCTVNNVPASLKPGSSFTPSVTVTNTGTGTIKPALITTVMVNGGATTSLNNLTFPLINPGASATVKLNTYVLGTRTLASAGSLLSHTDAYAGSTQNAAFQCAQNFAINVPSVSSTTVSPANWQQLSHASLTTDGTRKVVKLNSVAYGSGTVDSSSATSALWKVDQFLYSNRGKNVKVCTSARSTGATASVLVEVRNAAAGSNQLDRMFNYAKSYSNQCFTFTVRNGYSPNNGDIHVGVTKGPATYLSNVTLTVQ